MTDVVQPPSLIRALALMTPNSASQAAPPSLSTPIISRALKPQAEAAHLLQAVSFDAAIRRLRLLTLKK